MKKIKLNTAKLQLKKEQVTALNNEKMGMINGGNSIVQDPNEAFTSIFNCSRRKVCSSNQPTNPDPGTGSRNPDLCWTYDLVNTCDGM